MAEETLKAAEAANATAIEALKVRKEGEGVVRINRSLDGQTITIYLQHPVLADIIDKMTDGNAPADSYDPIFKPILRYWADQPAHAQRVISKPAVSKITKNFVADPKWGWDAPRGVLLYNAQALREGFTLTYKVDAPFAPDTARKWGKMFLDGCQDIISNARPFEMTWVQREKITVGEPAAAKGPIF